jgi:hypothetical protein
MLATYFSDDTGPTDGCPADQYKDAATGQCMAITCPESSYFDRDTNKCVPFDPAATGPMTTTTTPDPAITVTNVPWYKNWKVWAGIIGGVTVVGTGVVIYRRRGA